MAAHTKKSASHAAAASAHTETAASSNAQPATNAAASSAIPTGDSKAASALHKDALAAVPADSTPAAMKSASTGVAPAPANSVTRKPAAGSAAPISASTARGERAVPPASAKSSARPAAQTASPLPLHLAEKTRPDLFATTETANAATGSALGASKTSDHTQDNPLAAVGDTWKMIAYLVPTLLAILGCLHLLKRFQMRTGRLPGPLTNANWGGGRTAPAPRGNTNVLGAILNGFRLPSARSQSRSSIRVLESAPLGGAQLHLLEVRGRVLLLGATPSSLNLLTEFEARSEDQSDDFRDMLHAAAVDMDAMDYAQPDLPATATVSTLEELLRETGQAVSRRSRRLRTVGEVEVGEDE